MTVVYQRGFVADLNGLPLDNGKLWIGVANQDPEVSPVDTFWDEALTLPATQPLTLSAGYVVNAGVRAAVYVEEETFSFRLRNKASIQVDYVPAVNDELAALKSTVAALATSTGSVNVGFLQGGTSARASDLQAKAREWVSLEDFGALGDGFSIALNVQYASLAAAQAVYPFVTNGDYTTRTVDWAASRAACIYCAQSGKTLRLKGVVYVGARLEAHATFNIEGNGATVEYLGIGNTLIAGTGAGTGASFTAWPNTDTDAMADLYPVTMFSLSATSAAGANTITLASVTGLAANDYIFIATAPTSFSSNGNLIPRNFEWARVKSINAGTGVVTLWGKLKNTFTSAACAFQCDGVAVNCRISNLRINTTTDAYQFVIRSGINLKLDGIEFAGESAIGAWTFVKNLKISNSSCTGAYGTISSARGTESATIDGFDWQPRTNTPTAQDWAFFAEESFYRLTVRDFQARGGAFFAGSLDLAGGQGKRLLTIDGGIFDTKAAPNGATGALQVANMTGVDAHARGVTFEGTCVVPDSGLFPGTIPSSLTWISGTDAADVFKFAGCQFHSTNAGKAIGTGSSTQGLIMPDSFNTYSTCSPPAWSALTLGGAYTAAAGFSTPAFYKEGRWIHLAGAVDTNASADGTTIATLPAGNRPAATKAFAMAAYGGTTESDKLQISTGGALVLVTRNGATTVSLEGVSFCLDS